MMKLDFHHKKTIIVAGLVLLIGADAAMAIYSVSMASSKRSPQQELVARTTQLKVLQADVERARDIKKDAPAAKRECDEFENSLLAAGTGYSVVSSELADIGHKAGLQISSLGFHQKDLAGRGIAEVAVDVTVAGDYKSVVHFLNGLQRSANNYAVDSLAVTKESAQGPLSGGVKVDFHLKAYFKAGA
jgi:Type II secretion system (T2SS), protein M subtype b